MMPGLPPSLLHLLNTHTQAYDRMLIVSVADPDVFGPPGSGSVNQMYDSGSGAFYRQSKIVGNKNLDSSVFVTFL
jgi:hypothetical protein